MSLGKVEWRDPKPMTLREKDGWNNLGFITDDGAVHVKPLPETPLQPFVSSINRLASDFTASYLAANPFPLRIALGIDQDESELRLTHGHHGPYARPIHTNHPCVPIPVTQSARPKETPMTQIDKKQFVAQPVRTPAGSLAQRHLGSLVTITTGDGVEITSTLRRIQASEGWEDVEVYLDHIDASGLESYFDLNPKSIVLVRRPRPEPKKPAAKKAARR